MEYYPALNRKEILPHCNMGELWGYYAKWKKAVTKAQKLGDATYPDYSNT